MPLAGRPASKQGVGSFPGCAEMAVKIQRINLGWRKASEPVYSDTDAYRRYFKELVLCRPLRVIDHHHLHRSFPRLKLQSQLVPERVVNRRTRHSL
jgi:hypothetical protein